jgi:hypothetical protein
VNISLIDLSLLTIYERCSNSFPSSYHIMIFPCFSFPLCVTNHTNHFFFILYTNISFLLSTWVFRFESCHQSRQSTSLSLRKEWRKKITIVIAFDVWKGMKKGNNSHDWQGRVGWVHAGVQEWGGCKKQGDSVGTVSSTSFFVLTRFYEANLGVYRLTSGALVRGA